VLLVQGDMEVSMILIKDRSSFDAMAAERKLNARTLRDSLDALFAKTPTEVRLTKTTVYGNFDGGVWHHGKVFAISIHLIRTCAVIVRFQRQLPEARC